MGFRARDPPPPVPPRMYICQPPSLPRWLRRWTDIRRQIERQTTTHPLIPSHIVVCSSSMLLTQPQLTSLPHSLILPFIHLHSTHSDILILFNLCRFSLLPLVTQHASDKNDPYLLATEPLHFDLSPKGDLSHHTTHHYTLSTHSIHNTPLLPYHTLHTLPTHTLNILSGPCTSTCPPKVSSRPCSIKNLHPPSHPIKLILPPSPSLISSFPCPTHRTAPPPLPPAVTFCFNHWTSDLCAGHDG